MLPFATDRFTLERPGADTGDADDITGAVTTIAESVPCVFTSPGGDDIVADGRQELVDAVLLFPPAPAVQHMDIAVNACTGDRYRVTWARRRQGLGLDHQRIGLAAVKGATSG